MSFNSDNNEVHEEGEEDQFVDENLHGLSIQPKNEEEIWLKQEPENSQTPETTQFELLNNQKVISCELEDQTTASEIDKLVEQVSQLNQQKSLSMDEIPTTSSSSDWQKITSSSSSSTSPADEVKIQYDPNLPSINGPCEAEDLIEGIIFSASYLGSTQLMSKKNPGKQSRMLQAQEAVTRIKSADDESQPQVQIDLFISTDYVKILNLETQITMIEHPLRSISYIADIGNLLVIMARRKNTFKQPSEKTDQDQPDHKVICHVLSSEDVQLMAQAIGQAFNVAYQQFLVTNGIESRALSRDDYNKLLDDMYHDDLAHYTKNESIKEVWVSKKKGEALGVVIVESGWGSIVPTVILANLQHGGPAEKSGKLSIGDQIISINGTSLVGLPLTTCQTIIKGIRSQTIACLKIVSCPPAVTVLIKRPHVQFQLGFSIQDGIICSLMRGGIAERGGVRVGHRIIEINGQSVVATEHEKIVKALVTSVGEIQMKTMPASMFRLLTGQEVPTYI